MMVRRALGNVSLVALGLAASAGLIAGFGGKTEVPWPAGRAPSEVELGELVADAIELVELERFEEFRDAKEKGEDSGHSTVFQEDIDAGQYTADDLFALGDAVFGHEFRALDGYGASAAYPITQRVHDGERGGLDSFSCLGCHSVGGPDGAGSAPQNAYLSGDAVSIESTLVRNPPALLGLGMIQALAADLSAELQRSRDAALLSASESGLVVTAQLETRGISFGSLRAFPNGKIEYAVEGVDEDLVLKPFGWKGQFPTLRRAAEDAARVHFGIQSGPIAERHRDSPAPELLGPGPDWWDPDGDGEQREMEEGSLTATAVYLATLEVPIVLPPATASLRERWALGDALFDEIGCAGCHTRSLGLSNTTWLEYPDTTGAPPFEVPLFDAGEEPKGTPAVKMFSDFKRHDMGGELADPHANTSHGLDPREWLTRPLWGVAETAPYMHDGRASTLIEAIEAHGGEGADSRERFIALPPKSQADLHVFLLSLTRTPKLRAPL